MRELLPVFLAAAFGNHLLLRLAPASPRGAAPSAALPTLLALLGLLAIAADLVRPLLSPPAALYLRMLALVAIACCVATSDARAAALTAWWRRHAQALAALTGANLGLLAWALASATAARDLAVTALLASTVFALLLLAFPALLARMQATQTSDSWRRGPMPLLAIATLALALSGLAGALR
jgi:Na+-translocating ferredoxin:NAD+ oxidoreductase RnfA subunit